MFLHIDMNYDIIYIYNIYDMYIVYMCISSLSRYLTCASMREPNGFPKVKISNGESRYKPWLFRFNTFELLDFYGSSMDIYQVFRSEDEEDTWDVFFTYSICVHLQELI